MATGYLSEPSRKNAGPLAFPRSRLVSMLERLLMFFAWPIKVENNGRGYLVIAPHPDDETLGCGATMARARHLGIPVHVAIVTDGSGHPPQVADKAGLAELRRNETLQACGVLGVPASHVVFLGFPDGRAMANIDAIAERLLALIRQVDPERIFAPSGIDNHADHRAVASALRSLVQRGQVRAAVYSYPIWFWFPRFMLQAFCCGEFLQLRQVSSGHYLDLKKQALDAYATQAGAFDPEDAILTPEFLRRFCQPHESFFESRPRGKHGS